MKTIATTLTIPSSRMFLISVGKIIVLVFMIINGSAQETDKTMLHIRIDDLSVAYTRAGKGPVLVLLHGFTVDARMWELQIDTLSKNFTVIAWDAPGAGQSSDPPDAFRLSDWADCLAGLLDSTGVKKAHIVGLSWGGILAQEFYHRHSDQVSSLILADTYAGWKGSLPESIAEERLAACLRDASLPASEMVPKYLAGMFSDSPIPEVQNKLAKIMADFHPSGFRLMAIASNIDTRNILPTIRVPTLLIWGDQDKRSPISIAHQMQEAISGAKLEIIKGAGHVSNLEAAAQFNKIVKDFCLSLH
ncbi:MAG TPA: alpha/beta fold hydrolase [Chitinophagaceae bacterium]